VGGKKKGLLVAIFRFGRRSKAVRRKLKIKASCKAFGFRHFDKKIKKQKTKDKTQKAKSKIQKAKVR